MMPKSKVTSSLQGWKLRIRLSRIRPSNIPFKRKRSLSSNSSWRWTCIPRISIHRIPSRLLRLYSIRSLYSDKDLKKTQTHIDDSKPSPAVSDLPLYIDGKSPTLSLRKIPLSKHYRNPSAKVQKELFREEVPLSDDSGMIVNGSGDAHGISPAQSSLLRNGLLSNENAALEQRYDTLLRRQCRSRMCKVLLSPSDLSHKTCEGHKENYQFQGSHSRKPKKKGKKRARTEAAMSSSRSQDGIGRQPDNLLRKRGLNGEMHRGQNLLRESSGTSVHSGFWDRRENGAGARRESYDRIRDMRGLVRRPMRSTFHSQRKEESSHRRALGGRASTSNGFDVSRRGLSQEPARRSLSSENGGGPRKPFEEIRFPERDEEVKSPSSETGKRDLLHRTPMSMEVHGSNRQLGKAGTSRPSTGGKDSPIVIDNGDIFHSQGEYRLLEHENSAFSSEHREHNPHGAMRTRDVDTPCSSDGEIYLSEQNYDDVDGDLDGNLTNRMTIEQRKWNRGNVEMENWISPERISCKEDGESRNDCLIISDDSYDVSSDRDGKGNEDSFNRSSSSDDRLAVKSENTTTDRDQLVSGKLMPLRKKRRSPNMKSTLASTLTRGILMSKKGKDGSDIHEVRDRDYETGVGKVSRNSEFRDNADQNVQSRTESVKKSGVHQKNRLHEKHSQVKTDDLPYRAQIEKLKADLRNIKKKSQDSSANGREASKEASGEGITTTSMPVLRPERSTDRHHLRLGVPQLTPAIELGPQSLKTAADDASNIGMFGGGLESSRNSTTVIQPEVELLQDADTFSPRARSPYVTCGDLKAQNLRTSGDLNQNSKWAMEEEELGNSAGTSPEGSCVPTESLHHGDNVRSGFHQQYERYVVRCRSPKLTVVELRPQSLKTSSKTRNGNLGMDEAVAEPEEAGETSGFSNAADDDDDKDDEEVILESVTTTRGLRGTQITSFMTDFLRSDGTNKTTPSLHETYEKLQGVFGLKIARWQRHVEREYHRLTADRPRPLTPTHREQAQVTVGKYCLTATDLSTLDEDEWLNDNIINGYLHLVSEKAYRRTIAFSSFFYQVYTQKGFEHVQRWQRKNDLFSFHLILIPIHSRHHWCLVVVDLPDGTITFYDSMRNSGMKYLLKVKSYMDQEAMARDEEPVEWTLSDELGVPKQQNDSDCGVFLCQYAKRLAFNKHISFPHAQARGFRDQMREELLLRQITPL